MVLNVYVRTIIARNSMISVEPIKRIKQKQKLRKMKCIQFVLVEANVIFNVRRHILEGNCSSTGFVDGTTQQMVIYGKGNQTRLHCYAFI